MGKEYVVRMEDEEMELVMRKIYVVEVLDRADFDRIIVRRAFGSRYSAIEWADGWIERGGRAMDPNDPDYGLDAEIRSVDFYA